MPMTILALGEVLWDVFPDGPRFGGAPANFACACAELGGDGVRVLLASAVGDDDLGKQAKARLRERGVDMSLIATRPEPTGQVSVNLDGEGRASYQFIDNPAWDHLELSPQLLDAAMQADVIYFGTLAQRAEASRNVLRSALHATRPDSLRIFDINLRPPYWTEEIVRESLTFANVVKLNDEELPQLAGLFPLNKLTALTRGANGSVLTAPDGSTNDFPGEMVSVVDTVGAGDAFTAALALGLSHQIPLEKLHRWASRVAAFVCTQPGGTPVFPKQLQLAQFN
jgi:fructokinase